MSEQDYRCALTLIPFDIEFRTGGAGGTHLAPSPDRIDPSLEYVPGNVRVLWAVNRAKGEMPEEFFSVFAAPSRPTFRAFDGPERVCRPCQGHFSR